MGSLPCAQNIAPFWTKPAPGAPEARAWPGCHTFKEVEATPFRFKTLKSS